MVNVPHRVHTFEYILLILDHFSTSFKHKIGDSEEQPYEQGGEEGVELHPTTGFLQELIDGSGGLRVRRRMGASSPFLAQ